MTISTQLIALKTQVKGLLRTLGTKAVLTLPTGESKSVTIIILSVQKSDEPNSENAFISTTRRKAFCTIELEPINGSTIELRDETWVVADCKKLALNNDPRKVFAYKLELE